MSIKELLTIPENHFLKPGESELLESTPDRNEANQLQLEYAKRVVKMRQAYRFGIAVRRVENVRPTTWGVYLERHK